MASIFVGAGLGFGSLAADHPSSRQPNPCPPMPRAPEENTTSATTEAVSASRNAHVENSVKSNPSRREGNQEPEERAPRERSRDGAGVATGPDDSAGPQVPLRRDLPPEFRDESVIQKRFERALSRSFAPADIRAIDCTAFPCVVFGEISKGSKHKAALREAIQREMGDDVELVHNYAAYSGVETLVFAIAPVPPDATDEERRSLDGPLIERVHAYITSAHPGSPDRD